MHTRPHTNLVIDVFRLCFFFILFNLGLLFHILNPHRVVLPCTFPHLLLPFSSIYLNIADRAQFSNSIQHCKTWLRNQKIYPKLCLNSIKFKWKMCKKCWYWSGSSSSNNNTATLFHHYFIQNIICKASCCRHCCCWSTFCIIIATVGWAFLLSPLPLPLPSRNYAPKLNKSYSRTVLCIYFPSPIPFSLCTFRQFIAKLITILW